MVWLVENVIALVRLFAGVALSDPVSFVLTVTGALLVGASMAVMGYLAVGALADLLTPDSPSRVHGRRV